MQKKRILFVDDEEAILATTPLILNMNGFEVTAVATVAEALKEITQSPFDLVLTDLNVGNPGDGFTIVSATKRTQPDARTLILSGFPDFENALAAIRDQVDDYETKPADIDKLVRKIRNLLEVGPQKQTSVMRTTSAVLREKREPILQRFLDMASHSERLVPFAAIEKNSAERAMHVLNRVIACVETKKLSDGRAEASTTLKQEGITMLHLVEEMRILQLIIFLVLQENLLDLNLSLIITDLIKIANTFHEILREALEAF